MSEIKPIGFMADNGIGGAPALHFGEIPKFVALAHSTSPLYDQYAIDRLTAERDDALAAADFLEVEMAKFQIAADSAKAERDAAVDDAERYRWLKNSKKTSLTRWKGMTLERLIEKEIKEQEQGK